RVGPELAPADRPLRDLQRQGLSPGVERRPNDARRGGAARRSEPQTMTRSAVRSLALSLAALLGTACGKSGPTAPAGPGPYDCLGQALPTTAPSAITVQGTVKSNVLAPSPLAGATVQAFQTGNATALATATSGAQGNYSVTLSTGGTPLDGYVRVSKASYLDTYGYPPAPLAADASESVLLLTS